jgi:hypothetical protein
MLLSAVCLSAGIRAAEQTNALSRTLGTAAPSVWSAWATNAFHGLSYRFGLPSSTMEFGPESTDPFRVTLQIVNIGSNECAIHTSTHSTPTNAVEERAWRELGWTEPSPSITCYSEDQMIGLAPLVSCWPGDQDILLRPGSNISSTIWTAWMITNGFDCTLQVAFSVVTQEVSGTVHMHRTTEIRTPSIPVRFREVNREKQKVQQPSPGDSQPAQRGSRTPEK